MANMALVSGGIDPARVGPFLGVPEAEKCVREAKKHQ
jgi:hypothetical protein